MKTLKTWSSSLWTLTAALLLVMGTFLSSCSPRCDMASIQEAGKLKTELPAFLSEATTKNYPKEEAKKWVERLDETVARAEATKNNKASARQWRKLRDEQVKSYLEVWEKEKKLATAELKTYSKESIQKIKNSLTAIEASEKSKPGDCTRPATSNN